MTTIIVTPENASEIAPFRWATEASTLRLNPAKPYPLAIDTTLGNGQSFILRHRNGDTATYLQANGCLELIILND
jgi:hypothetical protein